jgi:hypothetical protein
MIERASLLCDYFLGEAQRMLLPPPKAPQAWEDSQSREQLLVRQPQGQMAKRDLIAHVQTFDVSKARLEAALQLLLAQGRARGNRRPDPGGLFGEPSCHLGLNIFGTSNAIPKTSCGK